MSDAAPSRCPLTYEPLQPGDPAPYSRRGLRRLAPALDALEVLPLHWSGEPFDFKGRHFEARGIQSMPKPIRNPIPIWIGGNSKASRRRVAERAQGWMPMIAPKHVGDALFKTVRTPPLSSPTQTKDQIADVPLRFLAAETTREKLYERLHEELPYASTVETENWEERKDGSVRIDQVIYVERESQRKIVLGKGGQTIKALGQAARRELEKAFERRVHLFLFVKVRENWAKDPERLRAMGLLD